MTFNGFFPADFTDLCLLTSVTEATEEEGAAGGRRARRVVQHRQVNSTTASPCVHIQRAVCLWFCSFPRQQREMLHLPGCGPSERLWQTHRTLHPAIKGAPDFQD